MIVDFGPVMGSHAVVALFPRSLPLASELDEFLLRKSGRRALEHRPRLAKAVCLRKIIDPSLMDGNVIQAEHLVPRSNCQPGVQNANRRRVSTLGVTGHVVPSNVARTFRRFAVPRGVRDVASPFSPAPAGPVVVRSLARHSHRHHRSRADAARCC